MNQSGNTSHPSEDDRALLDLMTNHSGAAYLRGITLSSHLAEVPFDQLKEYAQQFVQDAVKVDPTHAPILRTMAEQLLLSHHVCSRLLCDAVAATGEQQRMQTQLATSLMAEMRRTSKELTDLAERALQKPASLTAQRGGAGENATKAESA